ncbi:exopolygalacturonate lyase domain protein, partial [Vibrio parahaemolyticus V-223/04]
VMAKRSTAKCSRH